MAYVIDFPKGLTFHTTSQKSQFFKDFKKNLTLLGVGYIDTCCGDVAPLFRSSTAPEVVALTPVAANVTQTLTAGPLSNGLITSTSAAATSLTLPSAGALATELGAVRGTTFEFIVDNTAGANIVTLVLPGSIVVPPTVVITGSNILTVAATSVGIFRLYFKSVNNAIIFRTS